MDFMMQMLGFVCLKIKRKENMIGLNTRMEQDLVQKHNAKVSKIHNQFKQQNELSNLERSS